MDDKASNEIGSMISPTLESQIDQAKSKITQIHLEKQQLK
jgi:hypothetical protein